MPQSFLSVLLLSSMAVGWSCSPTAGPPTAGPTPAGPTPAAPPAGPPSVALGQNVQKEGAEPYTPTKLEWALLQLRVNYAATQPGAWENVLREFHAGPDGNSVICKITHFDKTSAGQLESAEDGCHADVSQVRTDFNWKWLKVTTERVNLNRRR